ncbi:Alpha carbonic anhydrase domain-containing protein [Strongyloides ratti]|uniref:Carbonic anhydrase n=1 Tax=Strongyloides ratti TaxID=34506 RepID=A0A090L375_STRRB|nr:Alpha carbonic anhydrase domain-containing protein [Strongyloides ratti]CEF64236.1 Alpha carbonic anhydrase domain-containing protein [Strongyloides ratti]
MFATMYRRSCDHYADKNAKNFEKEYDKNIILDSGKVEENNMTGHIWNYDDNGPCGPCNWPGDIHGKCQSPIDIDISKIVRIAADDQFYFKNYDKPLEGQFINNGHSIQFIPKESKDSPTISGGKLEQEYRFIQYHFHWGQNNDEGSEHTLNSLQYPVELHLVHQGINDPSKLAVLGVFIRLSNDGKAFITEEKELDKLIEPNSKAPADGQKLEDKLPKNLRSFIRYSGSLTTPPCTENVTWTIFTEPISITKEQVEKLRKIKDSEGKVIIKNFRPTQEWYGRTVYHIR